ncbi:MAG: sugar phosphate isomerase/epimerase family protein, partial [Marinibacterium sp.]
MLPLTVGAALRVADLDAHRDWLIDAQRDLEIQDFIFPDILDGDFSGLVSRALRSLDGFDGRLGIHGPFFDLPLDARDPAIREVIARRMLRGLDACAALGGSHMVIHSPFTTWDHNNLDNLPGARDSLIQRVHDTLAGIVRRAEDAGIVLVMENIEDVDPRARVRLADSFGSTAVRVSLDTGHAMYA